METIIKFEKKPYEIEEMENLTNPFSKDFVKQRRFQRYMKFAEQNIVEYVNYYMDYALVNNPGFDNLQDIIINLIISNYITESNGEQGIDIFFLVNKPVLLPFKDADAEEKLHDYLTEQFDKDLPITSINPEFVWDEFQVVMEHFLYEKRMSSDTEITEENYVKNSLPEQPDEIIRVLRELISRVYADLYIYHFFGNSVSEQLVKAHQKKEQEYEKEIERLNKQLEEKDDRIKRLNEKIEEKNNSDLKKKEEKRHQQELWELRTKYNKLVSKYNSLADRYQEFLRQNNDLDETEETLEMEPVEVDMDGRYVFLIEPSHKRCNALQEFFPNATFIEGEQRLGNVDCVIAMTNQMAHHGYKAMKEQCKNRKIPFRHCPNTNIEMIKEQIAKAMAQ